jgi:tetratricopeptide (TPR) repeat protein
VSPIEPSFPVDATEPELSRARALMSAGAWEEALAPLASLAARGERSGEMALLFGEALLRAGRERAALEWLRQVESKLATTDRTSYRRLCNLIGAACFALGELDASAEAFSRALVLAQQEDDVLLLARATNNLGAIANLQGNHDDALGHYRLAIPAYQRVGQARGIAEGYHNLAITLRDVGQLDEADEHERRAIEYAIDGGVPRLVAMGRVGRAEIALRRGDAPLAEATARPAADELRRLGDPLNEADAYRLVGAACAEQRKDSEALAAFEHALSIAGGRGHALVEAETLRDRAPVRLRRGDRDLALADAWAAIAIFDRLGAGGERDALQRWVEAVGR